MKNGEEYCLSQQIYGATGPFPDRKNASVQLSLITEKLRYFAADDGTVLFCKHISNAWIEEESFVENGAKNSQTIQISKGNIDLIKRKKSQYLIKFKHAAADAVNKEVELEIINKKPQPPKTQLDEINDVDLVLDKSSGFGIKKILVVAAVLILVFGLVSLLNSNDSKSSFTAPAPKEVGLRDKNNEEEKTIPVKAPDIPPSRIESIAQYFALYQKTQKDFSQKCPSEYEALYALLQDKISRQELALIINRDASELDQFHLDKIKDIASPQSIKKQKQSHKDYVPILVNDKTVEKGLQFFEEKKGVLLRAYRETGVKPEDIMAVLNWESKFGQYLGTYSVYKIFMGQMCYLPEIEKNHYMNGAYSERNVMKREKALQRIERLKKRSVTNMGALISMALEKKFNLYDIKGSWAGAIGIPQFMPSSMYYAADGDNDGEIDLNNMDDAIFSIANYLKEHEYVEKGARHAFKKYNPEDMYVRGVSLYSSKLLNAGLKY